MSETINKSELARMVSNKTNSTLTEGMDAVSAVLDSLTDALTDGRDVSLVGFGTLKVQSRAARTGRNPQTGQPITIKASKTVKLKVGKNLKEKLNG